MVSSSFRPSAIMPTLAECWGTSAMCANTVTTLETFAGPLGVVHGLARHKWLANFTSEAGVGAHTRGILMTCQLCQTPYHSPFSVHDIFIWLRGGVSAVYNVLAIFYVSLMSKFHLRKNSPLYRTC